MSSKNILRIIVIVIICTALAAIAIILSPSKSESQFGGSSSKEEAAQSAHDQKQKGMPYIDIVNPSGFVNTNNQPISLKEYIGQKVILVDFMTYSCINCKRTFPYLNSWYEKYRDDGLIIIGIHTPEFAFEKDIKNVENAMKEEGITFPVVLDNDYSTWQAYKNRYWPRKYLIDIHGNIIYDHIGEGAYDETEKQIQSALKERADLLGVTVDLTLEKTNLEEGNDDAATRMLASKQSASARSALAQSPETYFGSLRNERLANGTPGTSGIQQFVYPERFKPDALYLQGTWNIQPEYIEAPAISLSVTSTGSRTTSLVQSVAPKSSRLTFPYTAKEVYIVAETARKPSGESGGHGNIEVWQDGVLVRTLGSAHVDVDANSIVRVDNSRLYKLIKNKKSESHVLELRVVGDVPVRLFAFTFGS
ncbi:MAG: hypothetical protein RIQ72_426 [Candidatus Parcubacteria bacterium]|jgi:thiol-disulfide isomerase/thioredoxin